MGSLLIFFVINFYVVMIDNFILYIYMCFSGNIKICKFYKSIGVILFMSWLFDINI